MCLPTKTYKEQHESKMMPLYANFIPHRSKKASESQPCE